MSQPKPLFTAASALFALGLAACAPAAPVAAPAPVPVPAPPADAVSAVDAGAPRPEDAPIPTLDAAPERWWLLDLETDRVRGISADRAYTELLAGKQPERTVVVAVIDSGIDDEHEDLDDVLWVNEAEIPGNNVDDDGNGYVDDVHGWNFIGGPGGEQVHFDTFEVTRLYAGLRRYQGADPDTLSAAARTEYERFREIEQAFREDRAEAEEQLRQMRTIDQAVDRFVALLRDALGVHELTPELVAGLRPTRPELAQARGVYLQLVEQGITPEQIQEQLESVEGRVEYGLNPDFDPRGIVGDNYADPREAGYGNPDIEGPSADHGTHVAGIIAAERNDLGIDGIASAARIMALRAVPDGDERDKDVANAIRYAVDNGAHIINMSFGKGFSPHKEVVDEAVRYAVENGVLLVHAAGNAGADLNTEPNFPTRFYADRAASPLWIEVGASSWQGEGRLAAPFSNYGTGQVDVFAPGTDILSTVPESDYQRNSGTSMAAPVVTGLAALLMSYYPELSPAQVKQIILDSAVRYPDEMVLLPGSEGESIAFARLSDTAGVVNAYAAVRMAEEMTR